MKIRNDSPGIRGINVKGEDGEPVLREIAPGETVDVELFRKNDPIVEAMIESRDLHEVRSRAKASDDDDKDEDEKPAARTAFRDPAPSSTTTTGMSAPAGATTAGASAPAGATSPNTKR